MSNLTNVIPVLFVSVPNKFYGKFRSFSKERNHVNKKRKEKWCIYCSIEWLIYQNTWSSNFCYISLRTFRIVRQNRQTYDDFSWNGDTRIQQVDYNREALCLLWTAYQLEAAFKADKVVHGHVVPLGDPAINSERLLVADCLDLCEYRDARDRIKWKFINVYTTREHISVEFFAVNDVRCELL